MLKFKLFLKKLWGFVKKNWYWLSGVIVLIYFLIRNSVFSNSYKNLAKDFSLLNQYRKKDYKDKVEEQENEIKKRREVIDKYNESLEKIDKRYEEKEQEAKAQAKKDAKRLAKEYEEDPKKFVDEIAEEYNLEVVE